MRAFLRSFGCAAKGFVTAVKTERNLRFDLCMAVHVMVFSIAFFELTKTERAVLAVVIFGVLSMELFNSAIERVVDKISPSKNEEAGRIKDVAAGAVLVFCAGAVCCGIFLFWDMAAFAAMFAFFAQNPLWIIVLAASLAASFWFVFCFGNSKEKKEP